MQSIFAQWVQDLNTGLSLIGFVITVVGFVITIRVWLEVKIIKRTFLAKARLPDILKDLKNRSAALSKTLGQWASQKQFAHEHIKVTVSLLETSTSLLQPNDRKEIERIKMKFEATARNHPSTALSDKSLIWDLYTDIQSCITTLEQIIERMKLD